MVARRTPATSRTTGAVGRPVGPLATALLAWRRVVTAGFRVLERSGSRASAKTALVIRYLRDPGPTLASADAAERRILKEAGTIALLVGVAVSFLVPTAVGGTLQRRFLAAGWTAVWALARLFIMRTVARGALAERPSDIDDAWGPGLLPFAIAVVSPLGLVALGASAWMTAAGLDALGADPAGSRRVVAWAVGGQLAVETAAWLARGGLIPLLGLVG